MKRHVDDIAAKYIVPPETCDGAVMFVPAEAVFAEIHAYQSDEVDYAMQKQVWIVSPTTLMAVLNTARAVLKDIETREQVHIIKIELSRLGKDFARFDERMKKLAEHIRQANQDVEEAYKFPAARSVSALPGLTRWIWIRLRPKAGPWVPG